MSDINIEYSDDIPESIEDDIKHPNVIWNKVHESEQRITECEKRIEGLYDIIEELLKKMDQP